MLTKAMREFFESFVDWMTDKTSVGAAARAVLDEDFDERHKERNLCTSAQMQVKQSEPPTWEKIADKADVCLSVTYCCDGGVSVGTKSYASDLDARRAIAKDVGM